MTTGESIETIYFGEEMLEHLTKFRICHHSTTMDDLKDFLHEKEQSSVIVIVSEKNSVHLDTLKISPQIHAIRSENFSDLYPASEMKPLVIQSMEKNPNKCWVSLIKFVQKNWFLLSLPLVILLAYLFPDVGKSGGAVRAEWSISFGSVILIFFLNGLSLGIERLGKELTRFRLHLLVQSFSLFIIPFSVFGFVLLLMKFSFDRTLLIGVIVLGCTSTTISSNAIMTKNAQGNEYAALLNAILGNILGIFVSPALILYFLKNPLISQVSLGRKTEHQMNYPKIILKLCGTVLLPLFVGQLIHFRWRERVMFYKEKFHFAQLNTLALLAMIWFVFSSSFANRSFHLIENRDLLLLIFINLTIFFLSTFLILMIARLPIKSWQFSREDTVAIVFCSASKSLAMGIQLIHVTFGRTNEQLIGVLSLPSILYHISQLILGAFQVILFKHWIQSQSKLQKTNDPTAIVPLQA